MYRTMTDGLPFLKMHGCGNDFIIVDARAGALNLTDAQIRQMSDRHFGIGCDQFIQLEPSARADVFMRIYNCDATESGACGNATRCVADLVMSERPDCAEELVIETIAGLLRCRRVDGLIEVDMGPAQTDWQAVPLAEAHDTAAVPVLEGPFSEAVAVSMGNPHAVFFVDDIDAIDLPRHGRAVECHPLFPQKTNVEAVELIGPDHLKQRTWERGVGETLACGSGACAVAVAAVRRGLTGRRVTIDLKGGQLQLEWREADGHVLMTGPVAYLFTGIWAA